MFTKNIKIFVLLTTSYKTIDSVTSLKLNFAGFFYIVHLDTFSIKKKHLEQLIQLAYTYNEKLTTWNIFSLSTRSGRWFESWHRPRHTGHSLKRVFYPPSIPSSFRQLDEECGYWRHGWQLLQRSHECLTFRVVLSIYAHCLFLVLGHKPGYVEHDF